MKAKWFRVGLIILILSFTFNTLYAHSQKLEKPVFLDHYIETVSNEYATLQLYYLTNRDDPIFFNQIMLDDIEGYIIEQDGFYDLNPDANRATQHNVQSFKYHDLRVLSVELSMYVAEEKLNEGPLTFNEVELYSNDGSTTTVSIGEITIRKPQQKNDYLKLIQTTKTDMGHAYYLLEAQEDLAIEEIIINKNIKHLLPVKIDRDRSPCSNRNLTIWEKTPGIAIEDIHLPYSIYKGEGITIYTQVPEDFNGIVNSPVHLSGTTTSGHNFKTAVWHSTYYPYFTTKDIKEIIKAKNGRE